MANKRAYKVTSTTSAVDVSGYDTGTIFDHISIMNLSDGDVSIYLSAEPSLPILIVPTNYELAYDNFKLKGQISVQNTTGTGGAVYIHVWQGPDV